MAKRKTCWIITNSNAGALSQALGLAESMGLQPEIKHVQRRIPFSLVAPFMKTLGKLSINFTTEDSDKITAPWPDVVIACGAQSVHFCLYIRKKSKGKSFCIYLQDPKISSDNFDLVIKMEHDSIKGDNVIESKLALNRITPEKLLQEEKKYASLTKKYRPPYAAILIGGNTKRYSINNNACNNVLKKIEDIVKELPNFSFFITTSRRTPPYLVQSLNKKYGKNKNTYLINPDSKTNPYLAMLSIAQEIFVTNDSVNMVSEACSAGKKVHVIRLPGFNKGKPVKFANNIVKNKLATSCEGPTLPPPPPLVQINETKKIAQKVQKILIAKHNFLKTDFKNS